MTPLFPTLGIIGLGQIGASIALAARKAGASKLILGFDSDEAASAYCQQKGMIDAIAKPEAMAKDCDLIILAVPPAAVGAVTKRLIPHLSEHTVITDVASVKLPVMTYLENECPEGIAFIPGHPIAGGTQAGPEGANGAVFARKLVMLTPPQGIDIRDPALERVRFFWEMLDSVVEMMPAEVHDLIYAHVSHLPHAIAYAAQSCYSNTPEHLQRFLRLAKSDPVLWTDVFMHNQQYTLLALRNYIAMINHIAGELTQGAPEEEAKDDVVLAQEVLFPRIAASCLIATVSMLERQSGQRLARYSGAGFADVASPAATEEPEGDMEQISFHAKAVVEILGRYEQKLESIASALESGQPKQLLSLLEAA
jgi:cyclohexadieny/prephenate dehydrogenase